jgi:hypothetical protein
MQYRSILLSSTSPCILITNDPISLISWQCTSITSWISRTAARLYRVSRIVSGWTNDLVIRDTIFVGFNTSDTYALTTCCHCNFPNSKNQDTKTTHFENVVFINSTQLVKYADPKRAILHDVDGSLSGTPGAIWHHRLLQPTYSKNGPSRQLHLDTPSSWPCFAPVFLLKAYGELATVFCHETHLTCHGSAESANGVYMQRPT